MRPGTLSIADCRGIAWDGRCEPAVREEVGKVAQFARRAVAEETGLSLEVASSIPPPGQMVIRLELAPLELSTPCPEESYVLEIAPEGVRLSAPTPRGLFYALQTFRQALRGANGQRGVKCLRVEDWPELPIRGMQLDLKYQIPTFDYLLHIVDVMSQYKINYVLIEYENKFPFETLPLLPSPLALSKQQVSELINYCAQRYIQVMPMLHCVNWLEYILIHPEYAHLREQPDDIHQACPSNPGTMELFRELYDEMASAHKDATYFHIGADELHKLGVCPQCQEKVQQDGPARLYFDYMLAVCDYVRKSGKIPVMWADMVLNEAEYAENIPPDIVMMYWDYWSEAQKVQSVILGSCVSSFTGPVTPQNLSSVPRGIYDRFASYWDPGDGSFPHELAGFPYLRYYQDKGFQVLCAPTIQCAGGNYSCPRYRLHLPNISEFCKKAAAEGALGVINTSWKIHRVPWELTWPAVICGAEFSWSGSQIELADFERKFARDFWGLDAPVPIDIMRTLGTPTSVIPFTFACLGMPLDYPILSEEVKAFEESASRDEVLSSLPGLHEEALEAAQNAGVLETRSARNKLSLQHLRLAAEVQAHKAAQALCFHRCEQLLKAPAASSEEKADCANRLRELLAELTRLRAETERLFSLITPSAEVEDEILRRWVQEEALMKQYLSRLTTDSHS